MNKYSKMHYLFLDSKIYIPAVVCQLTVRIYVTLYVWELD
jgi:hypothetical protein